MSCQMISRRDNATYAKRFYPVHSAGTDTCSCILVKSHSNVPSRDVANVSYKNLVRDPVVSINCIFKSVTHFGVHYRCNLCYFSDLTSHVQVHSRQTENKHKRCPWCPLTFKHEINYQRHMKTHNTTPDEISGVFTCKLCDKVFTSSKGTSIEQNADKN